MQLNFKIKYLIAATGLLYISSKTTFAQQKNVVSAINYLGYYNKDKDPNDLIEAKKFIDLATADPETGVKAKTWSNRAEIYMNLYNAKDPKLAEFKSGAFDEAVKAYAQTVKYDEKKNFPQAQRGLKVSAIIVSNAGIENYKAEKYAEALIDFEKAVQLNQEYLGLVDSNAIYNAALSAEKANNHDKAIQYFQKAIEIKYGGSDYGPRLVGLLADEYLKKGDKANYIATVQKGRTAYPNDKSLIIAELNYFIEAGKYKEAVSNLELAMSKEPENEIFPFNIGVIYDQMANPGEGKTAPAEKEFNEYVEKAETYYKKALQVNPDYFDALYNLGALYFNKAVKLNEIVNNIKDPNKYKAESAKVDAMFKSSLPYLEKGEEVRTNDVATYKSLISTLQKLYLMTEQAPKAILCKQRLAGGPNGIVIGDEVKSVTDKLGVALKTTTVKGKLYSTDILDYPEYTLYMDGGLLTKWVKK